MTPAITVLIATYNRAALLPRAVNSVLKQTFKDFELIIIDDNSSDNTAEVVQSFSDQRIRYYRNPSNVGGKLGDREHVRRCVRELMRGRYFIYLCDDDYWLPDNLLERQIEAFSKYPDLAMAVGGHAHTYDRDMTEAVPSFVSIVGAPPFTYRIPNALPQGHLPRLRYLDAFAEMPTFLNFLDGGTLFSREAFIRANVFGSPDGAKWQAGYEFKIGPATQGDIFYIDEACVIAGVDAGNASFRGSQREHYLDCIKGVEIAFRNAWPSIPIAQNQRMRQIQKQFIRNITACYLRNRLSWNIGGFDNNPINHTHMFQENVRPSDAWSVYRRYNIWPTRWEITAMFVAHYGGNPSMNKLAGHLLAGPTKRAKGFLASKVKRVIYLTLVALGIRETVRRVTGR